MYSATDKRASKYKLSMNNIEYVLQKTSLKKLLRYASFSTVDLSAIIN